jgi:hypothetical protein
LKKRQWPHLKVTDIHHGPKPSSNCRQLPDPHHFFYPLPLKTDFFCFSSNMHPTGIVVLVVLALGLAVALADGEKQIFVLGFS